MSKIKLLDTCTIRTGKLDSNASIENGKYPFFTCAPEPLHIDTFAFDEDAILLAGNNAQGNFHLQRYKGKFNAYQRTYVITAKEGWNVDYIRYSIEISLNHLKSISQGSQTKFLTMSMLDDFYIDKRTEKEQEHLISVLKAIDDKVNLNKQINDNLQHQLKLMYDYWFTQFDFPDENGKPYRASGGAMVWNEQLKRDIPSGWQVKAIGDLITFDRGISYSTKTISDKGTPMVNLASFTPIGEYKPEGIKYYTGEYSLEKILSPFDLVMCNTQQTAIDYKKDIIGRSLLIPDIFDGDIVSSHHVTQIKPYNKLLKCYLHYLFNTDYFHKYIASHTNGTNILGLLFYGVEEFCIPIPDDDTLGKFDTLVLNSEKIKSTILKENQVLISLRDWLLPMLMNGQATISD